MKHLKAALLAVFRVRWHIACALAIGIYAWSFSRFHIPGQGFTFLATIGDKWNDRILPELKAMDFYVHKGSWGYDGMTYAQIAMRPELGSSELAIAVDNLPFRARRILFCWTAWLAGGGDPERALHAFTVQNAVAWLLLAFLLFRWLPPVSLENFARWFATLFSFGLCFSVARSLVDGPSLLLIACGIALAETGRPWLSAAVLGLSGLGKETNVLAGAAIDVPSRLVRREWTLFAARGLLVVLPLVVWIVYLHILFGDAETVGKRNFNLPFAAYFAKWAETIGELESGQLATGLPNLYVVVSLTTQLLFFALRPRWHDRWWRVGAVLSLLMIVLGGAVWEGHPSAAARVLLPMLLAFNLTVPRGWRWGAVLILGNLSILGSPYLLKPAPVEDFRVEGPVALRKAPGVGLVSLDFQPGWYGIERSDHEHWRWSSGSSGIVFKNPHEFAVVAELTFGLRSRGPRATRIEADGVTLWSGIVSDDEQNLRFEISLPPGESRWWFETPDPSERAGGTDDRLIAFNLRNFKMRLLSRADDPPGG